MTSSTYLYLGLIWVLFFWYYRDYRLDLFRQRLFTLRDRLFDLAAEEKLDFDSKPYGMLRSSINGFIRNGHKLGLLDLIAFLILHAQNQESKELAKNFHNDWKTSLDSLSAEVRTQLLEIRKSMHYFIIEQVLFTSAILMFTLISFLCWALLCKIGNGICNRIFPQSYREKIVDMLDSSASNKAMPV